MLQLQSQSSRSLTAALNTAAKCISSKSQVAIFDHVLLTWQNGQFFFTTSTGEAQLTIPAPLSLVNGKYEQPMAIPVARLLSYLSSLPECVVNLTFAEGNALKLDYCLNINDNTKSGKISLTYLDGNDFPKLAGIKEEHTHIVLPTNVFNAAVENAKTFSAQDELRPVLNGLCIDIVKDLSECVLVSTNGQSLIKTTHSNDPKIGGSDFFRSGGPCTTIIHKNFFRALSVFADCEAVDIESDGTTIRIFSGDIEFICKAIEGKFPNYNSVIPRENPHYFCFDKKEMLSVIKRVSIFGSDASKLIALTKDGLFVNLRAEDLEFSTSAEDQVVLSDSQCNEKFAIGFNSQILTNAINAIDAPTLRMKFSEPSRPCVITADTAAPTTLTLCMPMLLN